ncbi:hypothetical protein L6164_014627 [Bauhinia variegata]|uniref:Uncharacterized protein n=1 Tax=Bauhinia variegata TaxID=167791 RepID=A0ACB9NIG9_BAUVA|nr:hypothetical protein L6164_014627 [Bauhinia variegata]
MNNWPLSADAIGVESFFLLVNFCNSDFYCGICGVCYEQSRLIPFLVVLGPFSSVVRDATEQMGMEVQALAPRMKRVCQEDSMPKMKFYLLKSPSTLVSTITPRALVSRDSVNGLCSHKSIQKIRSCNICL